MTHPDIPEAPEPGTVTYDSATGIVTMDGASLLRVARGLIVLALIGITLYFVIPRPADPGIAACARLKAHTEAGTYPNATERDEIAADFRRSDMDHLKDAGETEYLRTHGLFRFIGPGGSLPSIGPDGAPVPAPGAAVDLTDFRALYTACLYADVFDVA